MTLEPGMMRRSQMVKSTLIWIPHGILSAAPLVTITLRGGMTSAFKVQLSEIIQLTAAGGCPQAGRTAQPVGPNSVIIAKVRTIAPNLILLITACITRYLQAEYRGVILPYGHPLPRQISPLARRYMRVVPPV